MIDIKSIIAECDLGYLWPSHKVKEIAVALGAALAEKAMSEIKVEELLKTLAAGKRRHQECEDPWYSCPLSENGCADERQEGCTCGADDTNKLLDQAIAALSAPVQPKSCAWVADEDGVYDTTCGNRYCIFEGTPQENDMAFCCYCGGSIPPPPAEGEKM